MAVTDLDLNDYDVVLNSVQSDLAGFTHDTVQVTWSDTMKNGSLLDSTGAELAVASAGTEYYVVDDIIARNLDEDLTAGDTVELACAHMGCVFNEGVIVYSDDVIGTTGKTTLQGYFNKFDSIETE